ncbi:MAG: hypothetical protein H7249_02000 [Chitinophagaceae bacterium]|nr:hypothetical protein [Oligoflexus sp.]
MARSTPTKPTQSTDSKGMDNPSKLARSASPAKASKGKAKVASRTTQKAKAAATSTAKKIPSPKAKIAARVTKSKIASSSSPEKDSEKSSFSKSAALRIGISNSSDINSDTLKKAFARSKEKASATARDVSVSAKDAINSAREAISSTRVALTSAKDAILSARDAIRDSNDFEHPGKKSHILKDLTSTLKSLFTPHS